MGHGPADEQLASLLTELRGGPDGGATEPEFVLTPAGPGGHPRGRALRVVGPGRREREYQERVGELGAALEAARRELEQAALVERGTGRYVARVEADLAASAAREAEVRQQLHRTLVALGATQREVDGLREALAAASRRALPASPPRGWLATWVAKLAPRRGLWFGA